MRSPIRLVAAAAMLAATAASQSAGAVEIDAREFWTVADVQGSVTARTGDNPWNGLRELSPGDKVGPYSMVEAGPGSEALLVRAGDRMTLYANTEIEMPPVDRSEGLTRVLQRAGDALFRITKRGQPHFEVETPYLVAGVRGTAFGVTTTADDAEVHVVEGLVAVGDAGAPAGEATLVNPMERASAGRNGGAAAGTATINAVQDWDDRTIEQAALTDAVAANGPEAVREALSVPGGLAVSDLQDVADRLAARQQAALQRATSAPSAQSNALAALAQASAGRLEAAIDEKEAAAEAASENRSAQGAANASATGLAASSSANSRSSGGESQSTHGNSGNANGNGNGNGGYGSNGGSCTGSGNNCDGNSSRGNGNSGNNGNSGSSSNGNSGNNGNGNGNSGNNGNGNGNNGNNGNHGNGNNGNGKGNS